MTTKVTTPELQDILTHTATVHRNMTVSELVETAVRKGEGILTETGALSVTTGKYTGRSPKDKFIVRDEMTENQVHWGPVNRPFDQEKFDNLYT